MSFDDPQNPIFDAGRKTPMMTRVFLAEENGKKFTRSERRPRGRLIMMLDSQGNTIPLKLSNALSERATEDPYGMRILAQKTRPNADWQTDPMVPYLACPQQTEYEFRMPIHMRTGVRCGVAADGREIGEDRQGNEHPCKCMVALKAERMERQNEVEANRDPKTTIQQAMLDNSQAATSKLTELLDKLVTSGAIKTDALQAPKVEGGKK
jgi:hypothetical protein